MCLVGEGRGTTQDCRRLGWDQREVRNNWVVETQETWIQSLGWVDPWRRALATHSSILSCLGNPMDKRAGGLQSTGLQKSHTGGSWAQFATFVWGWVVGSSSHHHHQAIFCNTSRVSYSSIQFWHWSLDSERIRAHRSRVWSHKTAPSTPPPTPTPFWSQSQVQVGTCASGPPAIDGGLNDPLLRVNSLARAAHSTQRNTLLTRSPVLWKDITQEEMGGERHGAGRGKGEEPRGLSRDTPLPESLCVPQPGSQNYVLLSFCGGFVA